jgi:hypothetical protein
MTVQMGSDNYPGAIGPLDTLLRDPDGFTLVVEWDQIGDLEHNGQLFSVGVGPDWSPALTSYIQNDTITAGGATVGTVLPGINRAAMTFTPDGSAISLNGGSGLAAESLGWGEWTSAGFGPTGSEVRLRTVGVYAPIGVAGLPNLSAMQS